MDVTGHTITVKATINRTVPYYRADADTTIDGDVVSNHQDPQTVNYLLRPNKTELTKTNGLDNANTISLKALPAVITSYIITAKNDGCIVTDTVNVTILNLPNIMAKRHSSLRNRQHSIIYIRWQSVPVVAGYWLIKQHYF